MAFVLKWSSYSLDLDRKTHVMGVLNVTPDSFSDGGRFDRLDKAVEQGLFMTQAGADIIDIGGESARPYSRRISSSEEVDRVIPVIEVLSREISIPISIDTYKSQVAREALKAGASMINDISALRVDPRMAPLAAQAQVPVILMHMQGTPDSMQANPTYADLIPEVIDFLNDAVEIAVAAGIESCRVLVDPGIGFGKTFDHNLEILRNLAEFQILKKPLLIGTSRKAFIGHILGRKVTEREIGTMATVAVAAMNGAHIIRVHDVEKAVQTVRIVDAVKRGRCESIN
jgi:dihydropteroate synthase